MRPRALLAAILSLALLAAALLLPTSAGAGVVEPHVMFGTNSKRSDVDDIKGSILKSEQQLGRTLAAVRIYDNWDTKFPKGIHKWMRDGGRTMYLSVKSEKENGVDVPWRQVADAPNGSEIHLNIVRWARKIRNFGDVVHVTFNHEPETRHNDHLGDQDDYIDAWRRWVKVFRNQNADDNVVFTWIMTDHAFRVPQTDNRFAKKWYPGNKWVEEIGADVYNWHECRPEEDIPWRTPQHVAEGLRLFGLQHPNIPISMPEFATVEDPATPGRKAQWIRDFEDMLQTPEWSQLTTAIYFNRKGTAYPTCDWSFDSSPSSLTAITELANDPFFGRSESINYPG
ncbi:MAG: glycosyl hydrolase [Actinomycetota bacterium]